MSTQPQKKKFIVRFSYVADFEAENDAEALREATYSVNYGNSNARHMELKVVAVLQIPITPPIEAPTKESIADPAVVEAPSTDSTMPF